MPLYVPLNGRGGLSVRSTEFTFEFVKSLFDSNLHRMEKSREDL